MNQEKESVNGHIEEYLDYYCGLTESPEFAVLLKGQWGAGKTWFIKQYCKKNTPRKINIYKDHVNAELLSEVWQNIAKLPQKFRKKEQVSSKKFLYVSLYGLDNLSAIDEAIFQELHPFWGSEQIKIAGNIIKGFVNGSLKIDLNNSGKDIASWNIKALDIPRNTKASSKKITSKIVLIFDDLERCTIAIPNLLGYINQFIEHQHLKTILIADESKLNEKEDYLTFKEKLVGRTFNVYPDFKNALNGFIKDKNIDKFLTENPDFINDIYNIYNASVRHKNLRSLRQILLDFERIFKVLFKKAKNNSELLKSILKILILFSTELSIAKIKSNDITNLVREYKSQYAKRSLQSTLGEPISPDKETKNNRDINDVHNIVTKNFDLYFSFDLDKIFPSEVWWEIFFDKGVIDSDELNRAILSKYFPEDQNIPNWRKLYYWRDLTDNNFEDLLVKIESEYNERKFTDIGEIKHIFGIFLILSNEGLFNKSKEEILSSAKEYIDHLANIGKIPARPHFILHDRFDDNYDNLRFTAFEFPEFTKFISYVDDIQELVRIKQMPSDAEDLLIIMKNDQLRFYQMLCHNNDSLPIYYTVGACHFCKKREKGGKIE